jgi:hypothetical protein
MFAPFALAMNNGLSPTPPNARTGEFTPPGRYLLASENASADFGCSSLPFVFPIPEILIRRLRIVNR